MSDFWLKLLLTLVGNALITLVLFRLILGKLPRKNDVLLAENKARNKAELEAWEKHTSQYPDEWKRALGVNLQNIMKQEQPDSEDWDYNQPRGMSLEEQVAAQSGFAPATESNAQKQREGLLR